MIFRILNTLYFYLSVKYIKTLINLKLLEYNILMIENLQNIIPEFVNDAFIDSIKLIPSLIAIFIVIEIFENYFAHKITHIISFSKRLGPLLGSALAIIPQCGFSVIMTTLFIKKYITLGTLIAVYIATSDEAIPILLANPSEFHTVIKIILIKLITAIIAGYTIDFIIKPELHKCEDEHTPCSHLESFEPEKGCCSHEIKGNKIQNIIIHPIKHTLIITLFIFIVCLGLNYMFECLGENAFNNLSAANKILQTGFFAVFGLIPNCAVSVLITMMYIKGAITFGSTIAGLTSNAGLGLLILFTKKENWKSFLLIINILILTAFLTGIFLSTIL